MRLNAFFIALMVLTGLVVGSVLPRGALCGACDCGVELVVEAAAADACCGDEGGSETHRQSEHGDETDGAGCECVRCVAPAVKVPASATLGVVIELPRGLVPVTQSERPAAVCGDGLMDPPRV